MKFLEPNNLHWLWLALLPLLLWLFRRRPKQFSVSTLIFFRSLAREHKESAWLRQIKRWLSLLLTLGVLTLAVVALARPTTVENTGSTQGLVFLLDSSASMALVEKDRARMDEAKEVILTKLAALPDTTVASLVVYAGDVEVLLSRSRNRRELVRLLEEVSPLPVEGDPAPALDTAERLAQLDAPGGVLHVTDGVLSAGLGMPDGVRYELANVAATQPHNVGINAFDLRPAPLERNRYEGFLRVAAAKSNAASSRTTLEVKVGGRLAHLRELTLAPGQETPLLLPLDGIDGERLEVRLTTAGDQLAWDDVVVAALPPAKPLVVAWLADQPDSFTELALGAMVEAGRLEMWKGTRQDWPPKDQPDVLVLENWLPNELPPELPVVLLNPQNGTAAGLQATALKRELPLDRVRALQQEHPILYGISTSRLSLTQTTQLRSSSGLETLWMGADTALLMAGEVQGRRIVATAFSPSKSEQLALQPAYPVLLGNAIHWCSEGVLSRAALKPLRTGAMLTTAERVTWEAWDGAHIINLTDQPQAGVLRLNHTGVWTTADGQRGTAVLASRTETDVPRRNINNSGDDSTSPARRWKLGSTTWLLAIIVGLLILESFLFHRKAVY
jgi:hypothetical protein